MPAMAYCAIVAVAWFVGGIAVCEIDAAIGERSDLCRLRDHVYVEWSVLWLLPRRTRPVRPMPFSGRRGLFTLPAATEQGQNPRKTASTLARPVGHGPPPTDSCYARTQ